MSARSLLGFLLVSALIASCVSTDRAVSSDDDQRTSDQVVSETAGGAVSTTPGAVRSPSAVAPDSDRRTAAATGVAARPAWLGSRVLPLRPDGLGEIQPTPSELVDRRLVTPQHLPPPDGDHYVVTVDPVPDDVLTRSTWHHECPVDRDELRYLTVSFWGFDGLHHTGELIVNADVAADVVEVFRRIHQARFPIEEMRVVHPEELDAPPTGDGNNTTGFVCRSTVSGANWSEHAYGRAIDVNPFHNPYVRGDVVVPELASTYLDRGWDRPGMIQSDDVVTNAFADVGWGWGGDWTSAKDWMHFSVTGR